MKETKLLQLCPYNESEIEEKVNKPMNQLLSDGWKLIYFKAFGKYGEHYVMLFSRDTSGKRIKEGG